MFETAQLSLFDDLFDTLKKEGGSVSSADITDMIHALYAARDDVKKREATERKRKEAAKQKAKEVISLNFEFFEKIAVALAKKKLLSAVDIQKIKSECQIVPVAL